MARCYFISAWGFGKYMISTIGGRLLPTYVDTVFVVVVDSLRRQIGRGLGDIISGHSVADSIGD